MKSAEKLLLLFVCAMASVAAAAAPSRDASRLLEARRIAICRQAVQDSAQGKGGGPCLTPPLQPHHWGQTLGVPRIILQKTQYAFFLSFDYFLPNKPDTNLTIESKNVWIPLCSDSLTCRTPNERHRRNPAALTGTSGSAPARE